MKKEIEDRKCILCGKTYKYHYKLFGRGCLRKLYENFKIKIPKFRNKENYFMTKIAWKNHKYFLNKNQKKNLEIF